MYSPFYLYFIEWIIYYGALVQHSFRGDPHLSPIQRPIESYIWVLYKMFILYKTQYPHVFFLFSFYRIKCILWCLSPTFIQAGTSWVLQSPIESYIWVLHKMWVLYKTHYPHVYPNQASVGYYASGGLQACCHSNPSSPHYRMEQHTTLYASNINTPSAAASCWPGPLATPPSLPGGGGLLPGPGGDGGGTARALGGRLEWAIQNDSVRTNESRRWPKRTESQNKRTDSSIPIFFKHKTKIWWRK